MKEGIHPKYEQTTIRCACGEIIETGSTKKDIKVEICSKCHPFYTGKQKLVDTGGRVDRFNKKFGMNEKSASYRCGLFSYFFRENTQLLPPAAPGGGCGEPSQNFGGSHAAE